PALSTIHFCWVVLNPGALTSSVYVPCTSRASENSPAVLAVPDRALPRVGLVSFTVAFATLAPDGSETVPDRVAVVLFDCARKFGATTKQTRTTISLTTNLSIQTVFTGAPSLCFIADLTRVVGEKFNEERHFPS